MTDHDEGLAHDLPHLLRRRNIVIGLGALGLGTFALTRAFGGPTGQSELNLSATGPNGTCLKDPAETNGPFPADGTNAKSGKTVNALTQSGVVRTDLRTSFGDLSGTAKGSQLTLDIALVDVRNACNPLANHAIYLWHADASGHYSLYDLPEQNYLRGVVVTDANGHASLTTIFPGCYDGRWPHIHFEVFASLEAATNGQAALLTSQFAMPEATAKIVYSGAHYDGSTASLDRITLASDNVFGDNTPEQLAQQTVTVAVDPAKGLTATALVGIG